MPKTDYQKLYKENKKLKKELASMAKTAFKAKVISEEDYNILIGENTSTHANIAELLDNTDKLKKFIPKLKNRIDKRKKFLNECEKKIDTITLKDYTSSPTIQEMQASIQEHSIFKNSNFLRDLTVKINEYFNIKHLIKTFLEENKEFIGFNNLSDVNSISDGLAGNAFISKNWCRKYILKSTVMRNIDSIGNNPKQISHYISQLEISFDKLNGIYEWTKSSNCMPKMVLDKFKADIEEFKKRNKKLLKKHNIEPFDENTISEPIPDNEKIDNAFVLGIDAVAKKLDSAPTTFTYERDIKPSIKTLKINLENSANTLFTRGKIYINQIAFVIGYDSEKLWKPSWAI